MALFILVHGGGGPRNFAVGTVLGYTTTAPVPLSNMEIAAGMRWVEITDASVDDVTAFETTHARRFIKRLRVGALSGTRTKAQLAAALQAAD